MSKIPSARDYRVPSFDELRAYERRAHELRAQELASMARAALAWLRGALHIGGHHGTPVAR